MRRASAALLVLAIAGCTATNPAPRAWRRTMTEAEESPFGAWTIVETSVGELSGELLAVEPDTLYLSAGVAVRPVPLSRVLKVTVVAYTADSSALATWAGLGMATTFSHGYFAVFSLPIWYLVGGGISRWHSGSGYLDVYAHEGVDALRHLRKWARWPQGLPEAVRHPRRASPEPPPPPTEGAAGQACYGNGTCNEGLVCDATTHTCHPAPALGADGGRCYANGSCDEGLACDAATHTCAAPEGTP